MSADRTKALDAVKAQAKAEALREAAADVPWYDPGMADEVIDWLRDRADRIGGA